MRTMVVSLSMAVAGLAGAVPAAAANYTLADRNSRVLVSDRTGAIVWNVDQGALDMHDATDNLFMSNYVLRIGANGRESNLFTALGNPIVAATGNTLALTFANDRLAASLTWTLTGGAEGSGISILTKAVSLTNLTADTQDLHLFDYSDYDINFDQFRQADQAALVGPGHIVTTSATVPFQIDSRVTGNPDHYQISDFYSLYSALFLDSDGPTTLTDQPAPGVAFPTIPRDNAFAFQWDRRLGAGATFSVSQVATYSPAVPEPATWAMMIGGFALLGAALRRRQVTPAIA